MRLPEKKIRKIMRHASSNTWNPKRDQYDYLHIGLEGMGPDHTPTELSSSQALL